MASEEKLPGRPKHRFGFSGTAKISRNDDFTVDDVLDSMRKRVELSNEMDEGALRPLEGELDGPGRIIDYSEEEYKIPNIPLGKLFAVLALVGSLVSLWLYGALGKIADSSTIEGIANSPGYASIFTDPVKLGVLALVCLVPVVLLRRRNRIDSRLIYG